MSGQVASLLGTSQHNGQGAYSYSNCCCSVGSTVGWALYLLSFRQHGKRFFHRQVANAFTQVSIVLCSIFHIPHSLRTHTGIMNVAADALSRKTLSLFSSLVPQTSQVQVPQSVSCLLLTQMPNWGSVTWTELFKTSLTEALNNPLWHHSNLAKVTIWHFAHSSSFNLCHSKRLLFVGLLPTSQICH